MGNEFGHPEWIDFPREGNNWSYQHARRLWSLRDDPDLKFHALADFDQALIQLIRDDKILNSTPIELRHIHEDNKVLVFEHHNHLFCINLHPSQSLTNYPIDLPAPASYKLLLNTDEPRFDGFGLLEPHQTYQSLTTSKKRPQIFLYLPARTAIVLAKIK
jgi:1,4-alpha-glucan branching enzyme